MPKIAQFFATGKITPSSAGTEAWETAGRRIGPLYNQIGEGDKEVGKAIAALWDQYRLGIIEPHGGGGGSAHGGSVQTPISFGRNPGEPRVPYTDPQQYNKYSGPAGQFNARAHQEISQAAPTLIDVATQLASQAGPSGVTVLRGGQAPQQVNPQDMQAPGDVTVLRGGQAPQQIGSWPPRGLTADDPMSPKAPATMPRTQYPPLPMPMTIPDETLPPSPENLRPELGGTYRGEPMPTDVTKGGTTNISGYIPPAVAAVPNAPGASSYRVTAGPLIPNPSSVTGTPGGTIWDNIGAVLNPPDAGTDTNPLD